MSRRVLIESFTRFAPITIVLVFVCIAVYGSSTKGAHAALASSTGFTYMQMYSRTFSTTNLPTDGTTQATLSTLSFTLPSKGKVEVTAIFSLVIFDPLNRAAGCIGCNVGTLNCALLLDGSTLTSLSDLYYSYNVVSQEYSMTTTSAALLAGSHAGASMYRSAQSELYEPCHASNGTGDEHLGDLLKLIGANRSYWSISSLHVRYPVMV